MRVVETIADLRALRQTWNDIGAIGFIPTMGYLHAGHLSLAHRAHDENAAVVASIFVNPTQFGPNEDLTRYPRDLPRDFALLEAAGVDVVFTPTADQMYPPGFATYVEPGGLLAERLEAASRPRHFRGVATIVAKLLQLVQPQRVYFGQKDAQQVAVIRRMMSDLNMPIELRALSTIREADGLAMSSRNSYLGPEDRQIATVLFRALQAGKAAFELRPPRGVSDIQRAMVETVSAEPGAMLDYVDVCNPDTFAPLETVHAPALLAIAARVGSTRLIDNFLLRPDGTWDEGIRLP
jgi:pantoate--beta-alanine ligase